jgi:S-adenosylmethionine:tRNA-ribosyltransferase-isomerase (queuine synthetase)
MIRRVERDGGGATALRRLAVSKRASSLVPVEEDLAPLLALRYTNGFVTVEISHDALNAYIDAKGDVPLPIYVDDENGDRRAYDPRSGVRVIYDRRARLREVTTKSRDGLYIRVNFPARLDSQANATATSNEPVAEAV